MAFFTQERFRHLERSVESASDYRITGEVIALLSFASSVRSYDSAQAPFKYVAALDLSAIGGGQYHTHAVALQTAKDTTHRQAGLGEEGKS